MDSALWKALSSPSPYEVDVTAYHRLDFRPFDHRSSSCSVLVADPTGHRHEIIKGAPESVMELCREMPPRATQALEALFQRGDRVVAVAVREAGTETELAAASAGFHLTGFSPSSTRPSMTPCRPCAHSPRWEST